MFNRGMRISQAAARALGIEPASKSNKYNARKVMVNGKTMDSAKEGRRYEALLLLEKAGHITDLQVHVEYKLIPKQKKPSGGHELPAVYTADFVYRDRGGVLVVEDVKSEATRKNPDYVLRRKLMLLVHDIELKEV